MYLFDTNVLSELAKPRTNVGVVRKLLACDRTLRYASEMSRYELRYGAALRPQNTTLWPHIEREILPRFTWLPIAAEVSMQTADLCAQLRTQGQAIDWADVAIAATALSNDLVLVTRNVRHFERIPQLQIENWFEDA
jgi:tRNA(fMet)-specific endonuclease VapC